MPERRCPVCTRRFVTKTGTHTYCTPICRERARAATRPKRSRYGFKHKKLRAVLAPQVAAGGVDCARCGQPIEPGAPFDLDHSDEDPSEYIGVSHPECNRATATGNGRAIVYDADGYYEDASGRIWQKGHDGKRRRVSRRW